MALVELTTVKLHLRVDSSADDTLVTIWIDTAELAVAEFLNRNVYATQDDLTAAKEAAPAALAAATAVYQSALEAAYGLVNEVERESAIQRAQNDYSNAQRASELVYDGMVVNAAIKAAVLLMVGHLYENREDVIVKDAAQELPMGSRHLLAPFRVRMGV